MSDTPRFELQPARWSLHQCDNCGKTDTNTMIDGQLGQMWTDNQTGETVCGPCKRERRGGERGGDVTITEKYNAAFVAASKAIKRLEAAYRSMHGITEARAAYEVARRAMTEARNDMAEQEATDGR